MKVFRKTTHGAAIWLGLLCLVTIMQQQNVQAGYTMEETCAYVKEGHIADPSSCLNYGYCKAGILLGTEPCPDGYLYDARNGICNYADSVECHTSSVNICENAYDNSFVPDTGNCNRYCYCSGGTAVECNLCPHNQIFNPDETQCVWSSDYTCPSDSICQLVQNNQFVGDPNACGNFILCAGGTGVSKECSNGYYNPRTGKCQAASVCNGNMPGNTPGYTTMAPKPSVCASYSGPEVEYYSDDKTCSGFYSCSDDNRSGQWGRCEFGTHFNPGLQKCVSPISYACPYDRCDNLNVSYVAAVGTGVPDGCEKYLICENERTKGGGGLCRTLNPTFPYFDEVAQYCVSEPLSALYKICTSLRT